MTLMRPIVSPVSSVVGESVTEMRRLTAFSATNRFTWASSSPSSFMVLSGLISMPNVLTLYAIGQPSFLCGCELLCGYNLLDPRDLLLEGPLYSHLQRHG